jgi:hypothetical protein
MSVLVDLGPHFDRIALIDPEFKVIDWAADHLVDMLVQIAARGERHHCVAAQPL